MRNVDDPDSVFLNGPHDTQDRVDLPRGERRRWLVENDDVALGHERLRDFHDLLLTARQIAHSHIRIEVAPQILQDILGLAPHLSALHQSPSGDLRTRKDVFGDVQIVEDDVLLVDRMDSHPQGRERRQRHLIPVEDYLSLVGLIRARKDLDQRRLSRTVFAAEAMDLAALEIERDVLQRPHAGKRFRYVRQAQDFIHTSAHSEGRRLLIAHQRVEKSGTFTISPPLSAD